MTQELCEENSGPFASSMNSASRSGRRATARPGFSLTSLATTLVGVGRRALGRERFERLVDELTGILLLEGELRAAVEASPPADSLIFDILNDAAEGGNLDRHA
jgi:hypothetical protein